MTLRQRQPREEDAAYLAYVRKLPCLICARPGSDPAHIRSAAPQYGKRQTGMGEKPSDRWALPLCRSHHTEQHNRGNELAWWASYGIDPFATAVALYASWPGADRPKRRQIVRTVKRKPVGRQIGPSRKLESRSTFAPKGSRKFPSRKVINHE